MCDKHCSRLECAERPDECVGACSMAPRYRLVKGQIGGGLENVCGTGTEHEWRREIQRRK